MKLAVRKEEGSIPGGGFHYMLHPMRMDTEFDLVFYEQIGYKIIEVDELKGLDLLAGARAALKHQVEVAFITENQK